MESRLGCAAATSRNRTPGRSIGLGGIEVRGLHDRMDGRRVHLRPRHTAKAGADERPRREICSGAVHREGRALRPSCRMPGSRRSYDLAIMSTKGVPVAACCDLAARFNRVGVRVFVVHDFDEAGFTILQTLRRGTRLAPGAQVIDLGFRLGDVAGLEGSSRSRASAGPPASTCASAARLKTR